jgi:hypothetical protein
VYQRVGHSLAPRAFFCGGSLPKNFLDEGCILPLIPYNGRRTVQGTEIDRDEEIRRLAYKFWQEAGCPVQHWLKAERIWLEEHRPKDKPEVSASPGEDEDKPALLTGELTRLTTQAKLRRRLPPIPIRPTLG